MIKSLCVGLPDQMPVLVLWGDGDVVLGQELISNTHEVGRRV